MWSLSSFQAERQSPWASCYKVTKKQGFPEINFPHIVAAVSCWFTFRSSDHAEVMEVTLTLCKFAVTKSDSDGIHCPLNGDD